MKNFFNLLAFTNFFEHIKNKGPMRSLTCKRTKGPSRNLPKLAFLDLVMSLLIYVGKVSGTEQKDSIPVSFSVQ